MVICSAMVARQLVATLQRRLVCQQRLHPKAEHLFSCTRSYPRTSRKSEHPPGYLFAGHVEQIDFCPKTTAARLRTTILLTCLWMSEFRSTGRTYQNLDRFLENLDLWHCAYQRACYSNGLWAPTSRVDERTLKNLESLKLAVCENSYTWGGQKVVYVMPPDKPDGEPEMTKRDDKDKGAFQDEIVQEVLMMILEPIYEARFSQRAFGFRPGRGPRACLRYIQGNFDGILWTVRGDLTQLFDQPQPKVLRRVLSSVIQDKRVTDLIYNGVRSVSYSKHKQKNAEDEPKHVPYWLDIIMGFAPMEARISPKWGRCNKLGPLLANIYFNELDVWMEGQMKAYFRPHNPNIATARISGLEYTSDNTRRMEYIRFCGHFLVSVSGGRDDALDVMENCRVFCKQMFSMEPDFDPPARITTGTHFLGHQMVSSSVLNTRRQLLSHKEDRPSRVRLCVQADMEHCVHRLREVGVLDDGDNPQPCLRLFHREQAHNNAHINKLLRGLSDWYKYALNRKEACEFIGFVFRSSLARMYAAKYKLRSQLRVYKTGTLDLSHALKDREGRTPEYRAAVNAGMKTGIEPIEFIETVPEAVHAPLPGDWRPLHERLLRKSARLKHPMILENELNARWDDEH